MAMSSLGFPQYNWVFSARQGWGSSCKTANGLAYILRKSLGSSKGLLRIICSVHCWLTNSSCIKWLKAAEDLYRGESGEITFPGALLQQVAWLLGHCRGKWSLCGPWLTEAALGIWIKDCFRVFGWVKSLKGISPSKVTVILQLEFIGFWSWKYEQTLKPCSSWLTLLYLLFVFNWVWFLL